MKTTRRMGGGPGNMWDDMRPSKAQLIQAARRMAWAAGYEAGALDRIATEMVRRAQVEICRRYLGTPSNDCDSN